MKKWTKKDIRTLREKLYLTQTAMGNILGISTNYVYLLETGVKKPSKTLQLLLDCVEEKLKKERR